MSHYVRIRQAEKPTDERGIVYLIHFDEPYIGVNQNPGAKKIPVAKHYLGWTTDLESRLSQHRKGHGSNLIAAVIARGIGWRVVRTWEDVTRTAERRLKNRGSACRICPVCKESAAA